MLFFSSTDLLELPPCAATIGFFDGVHKGHRYLIEQLTDQARAENLKSLLITFATHPRQVVQPDFRPKLLSTFHEKKTLLAQTDADYCVELRFDKSLANLTSYQFMKEVLYRQFNVRTLVVGYDHQFGRDRIAGFEEYVEHGKGIGMQVVQANPLDMNGETMSSSAVRAFLQNGELELVSKCLDRFYSITGKVVRGFGIGHTLGFPTANVTIDDTNKIVPPCGVYAVYTKVDGISYRSMLNIGRRPTLDNGDRETIETHLLHFEGDLYGKNIEITFLKRLRDERKFDSREALVAQLKRDANNTETFFRVVE